MRTCSFKLPQLLHHTHSLLRYFTTLFLFLFFFYILNIYEKFSYKPPFKYTHKSYHLSNRNIFSICLFYNIIWFLSQRDGAHLIINMFCFDTTRAYFFSSSRVHCARKFLCHHHHNNNIFGAILSCLATDNLRTQSTASHWATVIVASSVRNSS